MMKFISFVLFCGMLFSSCLKEDVPFQYIVRVNIFDEQNSLLEADIVTLKHLRDGKNDFLYKFNNTDRYYEFANNLTNSGEYQIWVQKNGNIYRPSQKNITLDQNKIISVDMILQKY